MQRVVIEPMRGSAMLWSRCSSQSSKSCTRGHAPLLLKGGFLCSHRIRECRGSARGGGLGEGPDKGWPRMGKGGERAR
jgi:hypothetical protein